MGVCKRHCGKFGFGYVSSTDDYKLVLVFPDKYSDAAVGYVDVDVNIFIFSMRANSWSTRKASHWSFSNFGWRIEHCGVFLNEAIHWINSSNYDVDGGLIEVCCINAFDLVSEELRQMPIPGFDQVDEENFHFVGKWMQMVVHLGGCLCLLSHSSQLYEESDAIGLWIKVFEFSEDFSTTFLYNISLVRGLYASAGETICVSLQKMMPLSSNSLKRS
ncbi:F-box/kelch-repeat protein At3g06240-like [Argentina anserina]|uniref:F-box/kelch-repeat protein At3g06240-like n=1 Tax=Argentina anserina TaxID=57926 RepID=UPI00217620A9|nr:F-box/kelch-repeat protein At3g06240-like [Potentilla anserina]